MADFRIDRQQADSIQNAEVIVNIGDRHGRAFADHRSAAVMALGARDYTGAARHLQRVLDERPDDATAHYYLALAVMRGLHPDRYDTRRVDAILGRLVAAVRTDPSCHHAKILALVINEGLLGRRQRQPQRLAPQSRQLVSLIDPVHGREILVHVPVPESAVWACLARRLGTGGNEGAKH